MKEDVRSPEKAPLRYVLIYSVLLAAFTAASVFIVLPYARKNIEESGMETHYRLYMKEKEQADPELMSVPLFSGQQISYMEREISRRGRDRLHLAIEAMLLPLSAEEAEAGLSSAIPDKTKLIGASEKNGYFFIELSKGFLNAESQEKALYQLRKLLEMDSEVKGLTVLCSGEIIRES